MSEAVAELHQDLQDLVGRTIADRYRVDDLIGVGGMGAVFRGHHLGLKRDVAIKVLHPDLTRDREISARFDREAHSASRLDHPNCLQVTDYGPTDDGMKFMVMQLLEGQELSAMLTGPLPPRRAAKLTIQILKGLEHAHENGVIHRDLKPENVFATRDHDGRETLKLVDFGIAKIVSGAEAKNKMTKVGLVFGTPQYMSPEQATGMEADVRTDLYSAGILLYRMLAGKLPFESDDPVALVRMQVSADAPPLPESIPGSLVEIVDKLIAKQRRERFQSAREAIDALESVLPELGDSVVDSLDPSTVSQPQPIPSMWTKVPVGVRAIPRRGIAVVALAIVAVVAWFAWPSSDDGAATAGGIDEAPGTLVAAGDDEAPGDPVIPSEEAGGPPSEKLAEIDRLLLAGKRDEADKLLQPLMDEYRDNAQLSWRLGRLLAEQRSGKARALSAYGDAMDADPALLDDLDFYAELQKLLRHPKLRDQALDIALRKMGKAGHQFLLEQVNRDKRQLGYVDRHRALEELARDPANEELVDKRLNTALDLVQATQSPTPCVAYNDALDAIKRDPDPYFLSRLEKATIPPGALPPTPEAKAAAKASKKPLPKPDPACKGLVKERAAVMAQLQALSSDGTNGDAGPGGQPAPKKSGAKSKATGSSKKPASSGSKKSKPKPKPKAKKKRSNKCSRFVGVFKKECWR